MGKPCDHSSSFILIGSSLFFQVTNEDNHNILDGFEIWQDPTRDTYELTALERLEKSHRLMMGEMLWPI